MHFVSAIHFLPTKMTKDVFDPVGLIKHPQHDGVKYSRATVKSDGFRGNGCARFTELLLLPVFLFTRFFVNLQ